MEIRLIYTKEDVCRGTESKLWTVKLGCIMFQLSYARRGNKVYIFLSLIVNCRACFRKADMRVVRIKKGML